ncbi:E3 ubiquitin-protein ligase TRIM17 [Lates calcarifer]|uniref:E3 ubiquitin-protein ligase TRIM17 n=1 Tax=Lates calcarifer TaxID=8187 RepID=A0AAJ8B6U1_LATCA|nr:E3 ubiquitin-protein ligase TRIM17 [Lates calcarifer]
MQSHYSTLTQTTLASYLKALTTNGSSMSCQSPLPESLLGAGAEGLASPPWSVDSSERCEEHEESLSVFCLDDLEPLCKQCAAASHTGHRVYPLTEAATDCKEELRTLLDGLKKKMIHFEKATQTCEHASRYNQAEAKLTEEQMKKEFESLHQFLREEEAARILELRKELKERKREAEERTDRLNQMIKSLEEKIQLIEEELDAGGNGVEFLQHYHHSMNRYVTFQFIFNTPAPASVTECWHVYIYLPQHMDESQGAKEGLRTSNRCGQTPGQPSLFCLAEDETQCPLHSCDPGPQNSWPVSEGVSWIR